MTALMSTANLIAADNDVLQAFQSECVEQFAALAQVLGLPRSLGQIYGLFLHPLGR